MKKLTVLRGVSGSGKSTWASAQHNAVVVSRDGLRVALFGSDGPDYYEASDLRAREDLITKVEHAAIRDGLRAGKHVVSDNTNIETKYIKPIVKIAHAEHAPVEVKVFEVEAAKAIMRNRLRAKGGGRDVPEQVIRKQHSRLQQNKNWQPADPPPAPVPYTGTPGKPQATMVDIDGTLAHMNDGRGPFDWNKVGLDDPDEVVAMVVRDLYEAGYNIVVMSGRDSAARIDTMLWLNRHNIPFHSLFMRAEGDMRADHIVKAELFDQHIRDYYDVQFVIDDRWQVCEMWLKMGLKVFNVSGLDRGEF